jgi:hypothetical protein
MIQTTRALAMCWLVRGLSAWCCKHGLNSRRMTDFVVCMARSATASASPTRRAPPRCSRRGHRCRPTSWRCSGCRASPRCRRRRRPARQRAARLVGWRWWAHCRRPRLRCWADGQMRWDEWEMLGVVDSTPCKRYVESALNAWLHQRNITAWQPHQQQDCSGQRRHVVVFVCPKRNVW